jgi:TonB family protein
MSTPIERWKTWEGRVVDGKFPLRQWLGGSDHSAVFLTERAGSEPLKAAIKLFPVEVLNQQSLNEESLLSRWAATAKLSHPHLLRLFESGRGQIDNTLLLYAVMEYAEENLSEILPLRALTAEEASGMLLPTAEALAFLHESGFLHGRIKPSNIMAVNDQLKISADSLRKDGEHGGKRAFGVYEAPEVAIAGLSPAADIWSLGATLVAVLTQKEPNLESVERGPGVVPATIAQPLRDIARRCLQVDPRQRCSVGDILSRLRPGALQDRPAGAASVEKPAAEARPKRWMIVPIVVAALFLVALLGVKFMGHRPPVPVAGAHPAAAPAEIPATQSPAPFSETKKPAQKGVVRGNVLRQVLPDISQSAQKTITGRVKVSVRVEVDASGNVSVAKLISAGPSPYFATRALAAARRWQFNPPQVDGATAASEWILRFQFARSSIQVFPTEVKP